MFKKTLILSIATILTLGAATIAYAKEKDEAEVKQSFKPAVINLAKVNKNNVQDDMLDIMKKNGFKDVVKEVEKGNYKAMDDFMNNISEEDFNKMIKIMRENGNEAMASMMESVGREGMIRMHNSMGGTAACHGTEENKIGMMGGSF
jgi:hypothetical protein